MRGLFTWSGPDDLQLVFLSLLLRGTNARFRGKFCHKHNTSAPVDPNTRTWNQSRVVFHGDLLRGLVESAAHPSVEGFRLSLRGKLALQRDKLCKKTPLIDILIRS